MTRLRLKIAKPILVPALAGAALLALTGCDRSDQDTGNSAANDQNVAVPADETASGVAAEMHNQMSREDQIGAAGGGMAGDQMGGMSGSGSMGDGQMGRMMDENMPMSGNMGSDNMADHHAMEDNMGSMPKSGQNKPMPQDKPMPMQDDM